MESLYPLKMMPLFKNKIWGGNKINEFFGIDYSPLPNCGEMWMVSGVEGNESVVENGFLEGNHLNELLEIYMSDLVGEKIYQKFGNEFPLLVKILDANDKLSVQVHPDDALAEERDLGLGKTEMWYVIDADKDAELISGFNKDISSDEFKKELECGSLINLLNTEKVEKGDVFYIPAKRIHALCEGILLAEIQQTSDITYRVYDWGRLDENGKSRELHIEEAIDSIDFRKTENAKTEYQYQHNKTTELVQSEFFTTNLLHLDHAVEKDFSSLDSFVIYLCIEGGGAVRALDTVLEFKAGECVLLPAVTKTVEFHPAGEMKMLEVHL